MALAMKINIVLYLVLALLVGLLLLELWFLG